MDSAGAEINRPALAIKIENSIDARPQTGLNAADMVWEEVVEGGISRYVAVYHSTVPPVLGPVRSVRPMDPAIAAPLHGLFAFSGGQAPFVSATRAAGLQVLSADMGSAGFYRVNDRSAPHNTYVDPAALLAQADDAHRAPPPAQFVVGPAPTALALGAPTGLLDLSLSRFAQPSWTWSAVDGAWLRSEGTTPAVEASDGAPLRAVNVVVLRVDVVNTAFTDPANNPVPETVMVGGGEALVATGGKTVAATWSKASVGEPVVLTLPDGAPVVLAAGSTWVELVPNRTGSVAVG
ncbi:DUF3048 domain-containing protein [Blastococcus sp. URHD0036]|uniref:DUF3048 domain-containing protein n=1 Tax=Blastococcus sp. URHD0036 TaxID=1380356 RepID=UPI001E44AD62|nr:DUF3048 domain-containing protein [Blastococcus sp. URHD0036]